MRRLREKYTREKDESVRNRKRKRNRERGVGRERDEGRKRRIEREKGKAAMRASRSEFASSKPRGLPYIKVLFDSPFPFYANP